MKVTLADLTQFTQRETLGENHNIGHLRRMVHIKLLVFSRLLFKEIMMVSASMEEIYILFLAIGGVAANTGEAVSKTGKRTL